MREIGVGLLGLGNVGAGVVRLLQENSGEIQSRLGAKLVVRGAAVRDREKKRDSAINPKLITTDVNSVIDRDDVDIICELVGGETLARDFVLRAINKKRHVVTANKALLAVHGEEIFTKAEKASIDVYYEAAVCGGVPIIRALREGLASDKIEEIFGIVNGTSNYILTEMAKGSGQDFNEVLKEAQRLGYAEADPSLDVGGGDAAHKLVILAMLAFGSSLPLKEIFVEGISDLKPIDFEYAKRFGLVIKSLAIARDASPAIEARVHPAMVPKDWLLASVPGAQNAVYVNSYALGGSMYYGAGAGMMPTAMSVVSDLMEVSRTIAAGITGRLPIRSFQSMRPRPLRPQKDISSRYYLRFDVEDKPGVIGKLTTGLGARSISMAQVIQDGRKNATDTVSIVVLTHKAVEASVVQALADIANDDYISNPPTLLRVLG